jgi:hypothetical protein
MSMARLPIKICMGKQYPVPDFFTQIRRIDSVILNGRPHNGKMQANARANGSKLASYRAVDLNLALFAYVHSCTRCEKADTSYTLVHARSARGSRGIFLRKSLSKATDVFDPYPTNIPYIRGTFGTCTSSRW